MPTNPEPLRRVFARLTNQGADLYGAVLAAADIPAEFQKEKKGWSVWLEPEQAGRAVEEIASYLAENRQPRVRIRVLPRQSSDTGFWAAMVLAVFYLATGPFRETPGLMDSWGNQAAQVQAGQWWRAVTALFLHADLTHLLGNAVAIAFLGTAVCQGAGWGAGWLLILGSGFLGNLACGLAYPPYHASAGASTAVFGALGILAGWRLRPSAYGEGRPGWVILGAGLALLGFLGTGPRADLYAHLMGMVAGAAIGLGSTWMPPIPFKPRFQTACLVLTVMILAGAFAFSG